MKKIICVLICIASVLLFSSVPAYAKEKTAKGKETDTISEITVKDIEKKIKFTNVDNTSKIESIYSSATGNGCYIGLVISDKGEEVYYATEKKSFRQIDLESLVKEHFSLTENDDVSIDYVIYADKKFYLTGTYYEHTEKDVPKTKNVFVAVTKNCEKYTFYNIGEASYCPSDIFNYDDLTYSVGYPYIEKINGTFYVALDTHIWAEYSADEEIPSGYDIDCITGFYGKSLKNMKPVRLNEHISTDLKDFNSIGMICGYKFESDKVIQNLSLYPNMDTVGETYTSSSANGKKWSKLVKTDVPYYAIDLRRASLTVGYTNDGQQIKSVSEKGNTGFEALLPTDEIISDCIFLLKENKKEGLKYSEMLVNLENESYRIFGDGRLEKVKLPFTVADGKNNFAYKNDLSFFTADGYLYMTKTDFDGLVRVQLPCGEEEFVDFDTMGKYLLIMSADKTYTIKISKLTAGLK